MVKLALGIRNKVPNRAKRVMISEEKCNRVGFSCNKPGHVRSQCTQKSIELSPAVNLVLRVSNDLTQETERVEDNQRVRRTRHRGSETPNELNSTIIDSGLQFLKVKRRIDGKCLDCILDTGATMSVMADRLIRRFNFDTDNRVIQVKLANGQVTSGKCTKSLPAEIQGKCSNIKFVILPQEENINIIILFTSRSYTGKERRKVTCIDFRKLNASTKTDQFQSPRIDDIGDRIKGFGYASSVNLARAVTIPEASCSKAKKIFAMTELTIKFSGVELVRSEENINQYIALFKSIFDLTLVKKNVKIGEKSLLQRLESGDAIVSSLKQMEEENQEGPPVHHAGIFR